MRMKIKSISVLLIVLFLGASILKYVTKHGCLTKMNCNVENVQNPKKTTKQMLYGTYVGVFPCADCAGKDIKLTINSDGTYDLEYEYLDMNEGVIKESGVFNVINHTIIETITPSSNNKTYYVYDNGNLVLSDSKGSINNGELAKLYILKKI